MSRHHFPDDERYVIVEQHESAGVGPFLLGLAIGAGVALLFAPKSGAVTRRDIRRRAHRVKRAAEQAVTDARETVVNTYEDAKRRVEEQIDGARQAVDLKKRQVNRAFEAGRTAARDARDELEQRIAEKKVAYGAGGTAMHANDADFEVEEIDGV
jgi:gas vesicle protein